MNDQNIWHSSKLNSHCSFANCLAVITSIIIEFFVLCENIETVCQRNTVHLLFFNVKKLVCCLMVLNQKVRIVLKRIIPHDVDLNLRIYRQNVLDFTIVIFWNSTTIAFLVFLILMLHQNLAEKAKLVFSFDKRNLEIHWTI